MSIEAMKLALEAFAYMPNEIVKQNGVQLAITSLRQAIAEAGKQEPVAWRNAAMRVGEDLCSVGPFGYYDMTAEQWLDWALSVVTVHALPQPKREWVGLTKEDLQDFAKETPSWEDLCHAVEAKLKEKNGT